MEKRKNIKQCVGIDCGQLELVCSIAVMAEDYSSVMVGGASFKNTKEGFIKLEKWVKKHADAEVPVSFVLEATGVYHEKIALHIHTSGAKVSVVLPNKAKAFSQTLSTKTVTDKTSSQALAQMGLEKLLDAWHPPVPVYAELKQLTRERTQLISERTQCKNQLHAEESGAWPNPSSIKRVKLRIKLLDKQLGEIEKEIQSRVESNAFLKKKIEYVCSIKGIGLISAITVIAETNGFNLIRNKKQLVSYAGLDIVEKQSGTSVHGKSRISRKGNSYIRVAMYLPAIAALRSSPEMMALFKRLVSKHGIKKKGVIAVSRKLLELIYVLWKNETKYDIDYYKNKRQETDAPALPELA